MLIAVAFWALAIIALTSLRYLHLWGMPQVVGVIARATMACVVVLVGLVGIRCLFAWWKSGSSAPVLSALGGMPGVLLFGAVASYLAIGVAVMDEASWQPGTAERLKYAVLCFGVLVATAIGGRAVLERAGVGRLLQGVLVVLIASCAIILASPVLRDLGILAPYRIPFRMTGVFSNPNDPGLVACMTAALASAFLTNGGPRALGWLGLVVGVAAGLGIASRTAVVVLGAMAVLFLLLNVRGRPRGFVLAVAGTALAGTAAFAGVMFFSGGPSEWSSLRFVSPGAHEVFCDPSPTDSPGADCTVLLAARDVLAGDMALNWNRTVPVNRWRGVTVDGPEGRVTKLDLAGLGLNGRIPSGLGHLDRLVSLSLRRNRFTGRIPPELGNLVSLRYLNLSFNALTGTIPPELAKLETLEELWLKNNRLTGPVPVALGELDLSVLRLSGNDFDSIPSKAYGVPDHDLARTRLCLPPTSPALFGDCTVLLAARDVLAGDAPLNWNAELPIGSWQGVTVGGVPERVTALDLSSTGLNGRIPPELGRLDGLVSLSLTGNILTGPVPPELGRLVDLRQLSLDRNALTGAIPAELGQLFRLRGLWLRENRLTGPVPPALFEVPEHDLGNLVFCAPPPRTSPALFGDCTALLAAKGVLAGDAPLNWNAARPMGAWQGVTLGGPEGGVIALELPQTGLNGRVPAALGNLARLRALVLDGNALTGTIPPELGKLADLEVLGLASNALTGAVPAELAKLSNLRDLWLSGNRLTGSLPPELHALADKEASCLAAPADNPWLHADCALLLANRDILAGDVQLNWSEDVPIDFWQGVTIGGSPQRVTRLGLWRSGLNGRIPPELGRLNRLAYLDLSFNRLTGGIPPELGALDRLVSLRLNRNRLTGPVPPELGELTGLEILVLSFNALSGPIPPELGELSHLRFLWLDGNRLTGPIPPELGRLTRLDTLSLDGNRLTGPIPPEIAGLANLGNLWLADNRLTGSIPPELAGIEGLSLAVAGNDFDGCMPWELHDLRSYDIDDSFVCAALAWDRLLLWRLGFRKAMEAPVFGHGLGALKHLDGAPITHSGVLPDPHNLYITLLGEAGIVPLLLFLSAIVLLLRAQWGAPQSPARDATVAWVIVIALYNMTFSDLLGLKAFMFLAGLSVAIGVGRTRLL